MAKVRQAIILAAGESSRFWPLAADRHKSMYPILGKPILQYTIEALRKCGLRDLLIIVSPNDSSIKAHFGSGKKFGVRIRYVVQRNAKGMADAILCARKLLAEQFAVVNASSFACDAALRQMLRKTGKDVVLASLTAKEPQLHGIFKFARGKPVGLIEKPKHPPSNQRIVGVYLLSRDFLPLLAKQRGHYALEDALNAWLKVGKPAAVVRLKKYPDYSLKYPWHLFAINRLFMETKLKRHRGKNVKIHPTARIEGKVWLGNNVRVLEYAIIKGPCYIGDGSVIGTHGLVREYSSLGRNVHTGFRTEIRSSLLFDNIKLHSCFVGDSILDSGCRFAAGTIAANRRLDRKSIKTIVKGKHIDTGMVFGTVCGREVKTGIHASIMPGIKVGGNSRIGPNTSVMQDVPDSTTIYAKFQRIVRKQKRAQR